MKLGCVPAIKSISFKKTLVYFVILSFLEMQNLTPRTPPCTPIPSSARTRGSRPSRASHTRRGANRSHGRPSRAPGVTDEEGAFRFHRAVLASRSYDW